MFRWWGVEVGVDDAAEEVGDAAVFLGGLLF